MCQCTHVRFVMFGDELDYMVGTDGSMWTRHLPGSKYGTLTDTWTLLAPETSNRYPAVRVHGRKRYVHDLVLRAFVGPPEEGQEVLHANDCPTDNRLENLRWGTRLENAADQKRNYAERLRREREEAILSAWQRRMDAIFEAMPPLHFAPSPVYGMPARLLRLPLP